MGTHQLLTLITMLIHTTDQSTAVDAVVLPLTSRRVQIGWQSGSVATYEIRRRDQLKVLACHLGILMPPDELSWGGFANWCMDQ